MKKEKLNKWYDSSFFIARFTIYITIVTFYIYLIYFPIKLEESHYCPLCGMTRATNSLLHFNFIEAYNYNNKVIIILMIIIFIILDILFFFYKKISK